MLNTDAQVKKEIELLETLTEMDIANDIITADSGPAISSDGSLKIDREAGLDCSLAQFAQRQLLQVIR